MIVGLGNLLLRDDGVGIHILRRLGNQLPRGVQAVEVGTVATDAVHLLADADKVLAIDAMAAGGSPGTLYSVRAVDIVDQPSRSSLHAMNLITKLLLVRRRPEVIILGIEPQTIEFGTDLTPAVSAAVPAAMELVYRTINGWRRSSAWPRTGATRVA